MPKQTKSSPKGTSILCWNVNGLRAIVKKGFSEFLEEQSADCVCIQETKLHEHQAPRDCIPYVHQYYACAEKPGYSGVALFCKKEPLGIETPFPPPRRHPAEGRVLAAEFEKFFLVNVYVPNAQDGLRRIDYRTQHFDKDFRSYLKKLAKQKPLLVCGDFNVAHEPIDLARPDANRETAGFSDAERASFTQHLKSGLIDIFRHRNPDAAGHYTWWSYRAQARKRDIGWRIDYFLATQELLKQVRNIAILKDVMGSDHCPLRLELKI